MSGAPAPAPELLEPARATVTGSGTGGTLPASASTDEGGGWDGKSGVGKSVPERDLEPTGGGTASMHSGARELRQALPRGVRQAALGISTAPSPTANDSGAIGSRI